MKKAILIIMLAVLQTYSLQAQFVEKVYKSIDTVDLTLNIYYPDGAMPEKPSPAIVFFFGGGWVNGNPGHFAPQCEYLADQGMICIAADYRTLSRHNTSPEKCVEDAKSAVRWIRANAAELMIDPDMLAAGGGSAGGHLAAACATVTAFDAPSDDLSVSPVPNALALFNPVLRTYGDGYGIERLGDNAKAMSPYDNLLPGLPPTIIFHGTKDDIVNINQIRNFRDKAVDNGDECVLIEFEGKGHGFFNKRPDREEDFWKTLLATENFLRDKNFLPIRKERKLQQMQ